MRFIAQVVFEIPGPRPDNDDGEEGNELNAGITEDIVKLREQLTGCWVKVKSGELHNALIGIIESVDVEKS